MLHTCAWLPQVLGCCDNGGGVAVCLLWRHRRHQPPPRWEVAAKPSLLMLLCFALPNSLVHFVIKNALLIACPAQQCMLVTCMQGCC